MSPGSGPEVLVLGAYAARKFPVSAGTLEGSLPVVEARRVCPTPSPADSGASSHPAPASPSWWSSACASPAGHGFAVGVAPWTPLPQAAAEIRRPHDRPAAAAGDRRRPPRGQHQGGDRGFEANKAAIEALEQRIGRKLDINHDFYTWDEQFPTDAERWDLEGGRIPMITWNGKDVTPRRSPPALRRHDPAAGRASKALGKPVMIRWFWEMDGRKKAEFAAAPSSLHLRLAPHPRHVPTRAPTTWPGCGAPTPPPSSTARPRPSIPATTSSTGRAPTDTTGLQGGTATLGELQGDLRRLLRLGGPPRQAHHGRRVRRPGASPGEKAQWVADARRPSRSEFPLMRAVVYFNANKDYDWRMTTSDPPSKPSGNGQ